MQIRSLRNVGSLRGCWHADCLSFTKEAKGKIYDVIVENVSQVGNYRSQFNRILTIATFDELLKKLQQKTTAQGG